MKSRKCSRGTCRNATTDPSGRCHHHRASSAMSTSSSRSLPMPTIVTEAEVKPDVEDGPVYRESYGTEYVVDDTGIVFYPERVPEGTVAYAVERRLVGPGPVRATRIEFRTSDGDGWSSVSREDGPAALYLTSNFTGEAVVERYLVNGSPYRYDGGPTSVYRRADGSISREEWKETGNRLHRLDGPAEVRYDSDGSVEFEHYSRRGKGSRIDGPYSTNRGQEYYALGGKTYTGAAELYRAAAKMTAPTLRKHFAGTPLEEISNGREQRIVELLAAGVRTPEGFAQVLENGTPAEWVVAWEEGER